MLAALSLAILLQAPAGQQARAGDTAGYWQQDVRYVIRAALDEPSGVLVAAERISYHNNSPDTLRAFYLHLYLNAFRPGSSWSQSERREGVRRFADLPDPYHAYERLGRVVIEGADAAPRYPFAPDSTVAAFDLPRPLAPGESLVVDLEWRSRLSVIPRRQGREGRRFDFTQWYPKVVVYDRHGWQARPLYMAGEFYGEFATYDVLLDIEADQVIAATGVPVEGDPGWAGARATPETPVSLQADWYGEGAAPGELARFGPPAPGRKRVRFHAERVHDFAWSANPEYVYEEGRFGATVLRTLYLPEDRASWGRGLVIGRMARLLAWMDSAFGAYPWPHFTAVHRIEGGGTEFPMVIMNGGPSEGLIFHEGAHQYAYGILANNEWKNGWLDEGFASFQGGWRVRRGRPGVQGGGSQMSILGMDLDGWSEPLSLPAELYSDFSVYGAMTYTKGALFFEMLRYVVGEEAFSRGLREYYARWRLKHVDEHALRRAMEDVSGRDLSGFFAQWVHGTPLVDYALRDVRRRRTARGWLTEIEIERLGDGVMPVDVAVPVGDSTLVVRANGLARREVVEVETATRPGRVELDPARQTMDRDYLNNLEGPRLPFVGMRAIGRQEHRLGWSGTTPSRRDRRVLNWMPLGWFTDAGGVTLGVQSRANYMGRFELNTMQLTWPTGLADDSAGGLGGRARPDFFVSFRNPIRGHVARRETEIAGWWLEGRAGGRVAAVWDRRPLFGGPVLASVGASLTVMAVTDAAYLDRREWVLVDGEYHDRRRWDDKNTVEITVWGERSRAGEESASRSRLEVALGRSFWPDLWNDAVDTWGLPYPGPRELRGATYARGALTSVEVRRFGPAEVRWRSFAAGTLGGTKVPLQRRIFLSGADPYETFANPILRSRGAPLARPGAHYNAAGGAGLRAYTPWVGSGWVVGTSAEAALRLLERPRARLFRRVALAAFADAALLDEAAVGRAAAADAGFGLRATHRIGPTPFVTRVDFPFWVSRPQFAVQGGSRRQAVWFRWVWSLEEAF